MNKKEFNIDIPDTVLVFIFVLIGLGIYKAIELVIYVFMPRGVL